jgi:hypothetical protein
MELDELKQAWQTLGRRLERQEAIQFQILKDRKLDRVRSNLRPLFWGQLLQFLLGIGLIALGVACWTRNTGVPGLLAAGILVHAFGAITAAMAGMTMALIGSIDYSAPVLRIQKRMGLLLRFHTWSAAVCGLPWWIMWLPVVVAFAGLGESDPSAEAPLWISISLGIGVAGLLGTWAWSIWSKRSGRSPLRQTASEDWSVADGGDGIRHGQKLLDEIARFEQE